MDAASKDIAAIQNCLSNSLSGVAAGGQSITAVIGDAPSHYSKSPRLWNAVFEELKIHAAYLPLDVDDARVGDLLRALKDCERFLGANVTVPHKVRVIDFLDDLDAGARRIQAVNTITRTPDGRLIGHNTDGEGFTASILQAQPDRSQSFIRSLKGIDVLLLGAGGPARAVAFHTADLLDGGALVICNRAAQAAISLATEIRKSGRAAVAIAEDQLSERAPKVGLIINSTTKGQGGARKLSDNRVTTLEPYSALAAAHPPAGAESDFAAGEFSRAWLDAARNDIESNHEASLNLARSIPAHVRFYDLIYHPEETVFLRHGRITGHATMNGKAMIINQAAIAFCKHICRSELEALDRGRSATYNDVLEIMYRAW